VDESQYLAAQADPELVELKPGHFMKRETAEKYQLMPVEPELVFEEFNTLVPIPPGPLRDRLWADHEKSATLRSQLDAAMTAVAQYEADITSLAGPEDEKLHS
jgi:23S rRNA G2445 N2-methylase RlmL